MSKPCFVYVMKFESGIYKIGISGDPFKRVKRLKQDTIFKEKVVRLEITQFKDRCTARGVESYLHNYYLKYKFTHEVPFAGYTEFFNKNLPVEKVLKTLEEYEGHSNNSYFNPFILLQHFPKDLRLDVGKYLRKNKLYLGRFNRPTREVTRVLSCLLANITLNKTRYILPDSARSETMCKRSHALLRAIKPKHIVHIRTMLLKYKLTIRYTKGLKNTFKPTFTSLYYGDRCGLPFLQSLLENNRDAIFHEQLVKDFYSVVSEPCKIRKEK